MSAIDRDPSPDAPARHWAHALPRSDEEHASPDACAPCFQAFWRASELNPTRALLMHQRIEEDAAFEYEAPRLGFARAAQALPPPSGEVAAAWAPRRSVRAFSDRPLSMAALSSLLWPMARRADGGRGLASGGGKYPLQVHTIAWRLAEGTTPRASALFWYDPLCHGLTEVGPAPHWSAMQPVLGVEMNMPAAVMVVTAQAGPHARKYGERGGRFMLLEAGAWLGAWQAETARQGLGGVVIGAFEDRALLRRLGPHLSGMGAAPGGTDDEHVVAAVYALGWPSP